MLSWLNDKKSFLGQMIEKGTWPKSFSLVYKSSLYKTLNPKTRLFQIELDTKEQNTKSKS